MTSQYYNSSKGSKKPNSSLSNILYSLIVHRIDIAFTGSRDDAEVLAKHFNVVETKEKSGERYRVTVLKESKGESISVYDYGDKTIVRVNTHRLEKRRLVIDYVTRFGLRVVRDYMELYSRIHNNYETVVNNAVLAYSEVRGLGLYSRTVTRGWERLVYNTRTDKHSLSHDLEAVLKLYRDRQLKEPPKLEIEFWARRLLTESDIRLAGQVITTILKLTKARVVYNDYDKLQDSIVVEGYDRSLHRALFATLKRISLSMLLNKNYRDKRLAIAELLDRGLRPVDIARLTGYSRANVYKIIDQLIEMGVLERVGRGRFRIKSRLLKEKLQHPLPLPVIVNLEYEKVTVVTVPSIRWNRDALVKQYVGQGWSLHPSILKYGTDGVLVFYSGDRYLLVRRAL